MKHLYTTMIVLATLTCSFSSHGQIEKGRKYLWTKLSVPPHYLNSEIPVRSFSPSLSYTHFFGKGFALHSSFNFSRTTQSAPDGYSRRTFTDFSLTARKYFVLGEKWYVFGGIGLNGQSVSIYYSGHNDQDEHRSSKNRAELVKAAFEAGVMYPLSRRIAFVAQVTSNGFPIKINNGLAMGFIYALKPLSSKDTTTLYLPQTQRGNWTVTGFYSNSTGSQVSDEYSSTPSEYSSNNESLKSNILGVGIGKFLSRNRIIGLDLTIEQGQTNSFEFSDRSYIYRGNERWTSYRILPYFKKFYGKRRLKLYLNMQAGLNYYKSKSSYENTFGQEESQYDAFSYNATIQYGLSYFLGKHFILESELGEFYFVKFKEQSPNMRLDLLTNSPIIKLSYVFLKNNSK